MKRVKLFQKMKKAIVFLIMIAMLMPIFLTPITSHAHNAFFLQVLIDDSSMTYMGNVVKDDASLLNAESKHIENQLGDFKHLIGNYEHGINLSELQKKDDWKEGSGSDWMPLTFPGKEVEKGGVFSSTKVKNDRTGDDADRAYLIKDLLLPGLNDLLIMKNEGKKYDSINALVTATNDLLNSSSVTLNKKSYTLNWGKRMPKNNTDIPKGTGLTEADYVWVQNTDGKGNDYEFVWRVPKGYVETGDKSDKQAFKLANQGVFNYKGDAEYITWGMIAYEGAYAYYSHNYTMKYAGEQVKPGPLASAVTDMMSWVYSGIKNILGLYNMDELIFNQGMRGSMAYQYGIMPTNWASNVTFYHWIFQAIAWALISFAIVKTLVQRNLSTINSAMRVSMIQQIQSLLITGFMLACTYPIISVLMKLNFHLVGIFYGASERSFAQSFAEVSAYSNVLGAIIIQFVYLFISIYMNYVYIIRAIIVCLLIASAPLFIVSLAFGGNFRQGFTTWIKELTSNIFLQSFHAFALSFFTGIAMSTRGIETLVVLGALIPLTEFFRQIVAGSGGETSGKLGMSGIKSTLGAIGSVGSGLANVARERSKDAEANQREQERQQKAESESNIKIKDSSSLNRTSLGGPAGATSKETAKLSPNDAGSILERLNSTQEAMNSKAVNLSDFKDGNALPNGGISSDLINNKSKLESSAKSSANTKKVLGGLASGAWNGVQGGAKIAGGVGLVGAGIATSMVTGEAKAGRDMINAGTKLAGSSVAGGFDVAKGGAMKGWELATKKPEEKIPDIVSPGNGQNRFYQSQAFSELTNEGDSLVHRNLDSMKKEGIEAVSSDGKTSSFTYSPEIDFDKTKSTGELQFAKGSEKNFHSQDLSNLKSYVKAFDNPQSQEAQQLRKLGIENAGIVTNAEGKSQVKVTYNQAGQEALGFKNISTVGQDRVVERKSPHQIESTKKTIDIPVAGQPVTPQPQTPQPKPQPGGTK